MNSINPQSSNLNPDVESRPLFKLPLIVLLLMGAYAIAGGIDRWADREDGDVARVVAIERAEDEAAMIGPAG